MRKILLGLVIAGFALVVFISVQPFTSNLRLNPEQPQTGAPQEDITLEPALPYFTVTQGESHQVLLVTNHMSEPVNFSLGHEHSHLTFNPREATLFPGSTSEIDIEVGYQCSPGEIELPAYLRAEVNGERFGVETVVHFEVIEGSLSLDHNEGDLQVSWNDEPAPRGVQVTYRPPGDADWRIWGETPRLDPPAHLDPGVHEFEFKAKLGEVESSIETFTIQVEKAVAEKEEEKEEKKFSGGGAAKAPEPEPEPDEPEPDEDKEGTINWDGGTYTGQLEGGIPHGKGVWSNSDGREYTGDFKEGSIEGRGTMVFPGGEEYRGDFKDGVAHGEGTMTHPQKGSISGRWVYGSYVEDDNTDWHSTD